jgi:hypothetical protein
MINLFPVIRNITFSTLRHSLSSRMFTPVIAEVTVMKLPAVEMPMLKLC